MYSDWCTCSDKRALISIHEIFFKLLTGRPRLIENIPQIIILFSVVKRFICSLLLSTSGNLEAKPILLSSFISLFQSSCLLVSDDPLLPLNWIVNYWEWLIIHLELSKTKRGLPISRCYEKCRILQSESFCIKLRPAQLYIHKICTKCPQRNEYTWLCINSLLHTHHYIDLGCHTIHDEDWESRGSGKKLGGERGTSARFQNMGDSWRPRESINAYGDSMRVGRGEGRLNFHSRPSGYPRVCTCLCNTSCWSTCYRLLDELERRRLVREWQYRRSRGPSQASLERNM